MRYIWHPCMSAQDIKAAPPIEIQSAKGAWLRDSNGKEYIDAISSWWVNIHGHNHPYLNDALSKQATKFAHVMTGNFTHEPLEKLARRLINKTNSAFYKTFFTSDGSSAIEASLKMAYQFFINKGQKRPIFIAFENGYHGETIGALAVGGNSIYKDAYQDILPKAIISKIPSNTSADETNAAISALVAIFEQNKNSVCAVILEPLLQCAGGMQIHSPLFVQKVKETVSHYGAFLILDEIATGFGRTGSFFAYEQAGIVPDFLCLSKALGAGYLPIAAMLISKNISDGFSGGIESAFLHSHSHTGNALAAAVANAGLDLFEQNDYLESNLAKSEVMNKRLNRLKANPKVIATRQIGMVAAIDLDTNERITSKIFNLAMSRGVFLRPLGGTIYAMPPYCITTSELELIFDAIEYCIDNI